MKLKEIKSFKQFNCTKDITNWSLDSIKELLKDNELELLDYSVGVYGINGAVLRSKKDYSYYIITKRNSNLFYII